MECRQEPPKGEVNSFVQRELDRIRAAMLEPRSEEQYRLLYAAQQALGWALDPRAFARPSDTITVGNLAGSANCSARSRPAQFSDTSGHYE